MVKNDFTIRRLGPDALDAMRALNTVFGDAFGDEADFVGSPPDDAYLKRFLARDHVFALVAEADGRVVGGLVAYALDKFESTRAELYIYDLAVDEPHRRKGVATALITALKPFARAYGAWVIFVQADYGDEPAIALYAGLGVREDVIHFDIAIEDSATAGQARDDGGSVGQPAQRGIR